MLIILILWRIIYDVIDSFLSCHPPDKCLAQPDTYTYPSLSGNCRAYHGCSAGRTAPRCCQAGFRYVSGRGCMSDSSCTDDCPLSVTVHNIGELCMCTSLDDVIVLKICVLMLQIDVYRNCWILNIFDDVRVV